MRASSFFKRLLPLAGLILTALPALGVQDTNGNGLSDVWERYYNGGNLFSASNSKHAPTADPDGDGWSNEKEAIAGTNPFSSAMPQGWVRSEIAPHPDAEGLFLLSWPTIAGKVYKLAMSDDLTTWVDFGELMPGTGQPIQLAVDAMHEDGSIPERLFWRVKIEDDDPDGDGLTTWEELALGTNPYTRDSDLDGIPDNLDAAPLVSATVGDPDGLNAPTGISTGLRAFWDFETQRNTTLPAVFSDRSGNNRHADSSFFGPSLPGMPSKSASIGGIGYISAPASVLQGQNNWSISGWLKIGKGAITGNSTDGLGNGTFHAIYAFYDQQGTSAQGAPLGVGNGLFVRKSSVGESWMIGGYQQSTYYHEPPAIDGNPKVVYGGTFFTRAGGKTDDDQWHHFAVTRATGSFGQKLYIDGVQILTQPQQVVNELTGLAYDSDTRLTFGRLYPAHFPSSFSEANIDRVRVHGRVLSPTEVTSLYHQDIDSDGLWDITETKTSLWRDADSNGLATENEYSYVSSPFQWQSSTNDTDGDEATDLEEQIAGTDIGKADTDGDLIPDGWELHHGLNPLDPSDGLLDPDHDGLNNREEWQYNTDPHNPNSDGGDPGHPDTVDDGSEVNQGSNPNDPSDGGQAPPVDQKLTIKLGIGDKSGSESEDYVLHCYQLDRETGEEKRIYTLRSGGFGEYKEETVSKIFRKGESYSFQIEWQGSKLTSRPASPGVAAEGPDFDYTFKVEPQGDYADAGMLIDSWDPSRKTLDANRHLLNEEANNVAETAEEFKTNFSNRRVVFYSIQTFSADRMFAGGVTLLPGFEKMELAITSPDTGRDFGTHGSLLGGGGTRIYDSVKGMMGYQDRKGTLVTDSRVWFLKDTFSDKRVEFYLVSGSPGSSYGKIKIEAKIGNQSLGSIEKTLQPDAKFAGAIDMVTGWAAGRGFGFDTNLGGPVTLGGGPTTMSILDGAGLDNPEQWATPTLIPFMMVAQNVEGVTIVVRGIGEGIVAGFKDDLEFVKLLYNGAVTVSDWSTQFLLSEIQRWENDPLGRVAELHALVTDFFDKEVFEPLGSVASDLTTLEGFKKRFWQAVVKGIQIQQEINAPLWGSIVNGLNAWFDDFGNRMTEGAERTAWLNTPFNKTGLLAEATQLFREQCYTFGYTFGYLSEQVVVGALTDGSLKITQVAIKGGVHLAGSMARRTAAEVAIRGHWLKALLGNSALGEATIKAMYERGMLAAAMEPTGPTMKKAAFDFLDSVFTKSGFDRATFNYKRMLDGLTPNGNIRKLIAQEGSEAIIYKRAAQIAHLLGDQCDAATLKNFLQVVEERLIIVDSNGVANDYIESWLRSMEGNPSLLSPSSNPGVVLDEMTPNAKARLKQILSDPEPGNMWKFDDPVWVPNEDPPIPSNFYARGLILETDLFERVYKPLGYTHHPTAAGFDLSGPKFVQIKSLKNPDGAIGAMKEAIDKLLVAAPSGEVRLHILKKPGTSSSGLESALATYKDTLSAADKARLEIVLQSYNIGPQ